MCCDLICVKHFFVRGVFLIKTGGFSAESAQGCDPALSDNPSPLIQPECLQCATAVLIPLPRNSGGATLGYRANRVSTPTGCGRARHPRTQPRWGWLVLTRWTQGSSLLATLGFVAESLQDSHDSSPEMWVM